MTTQTNYQQQAIDFLNQTSTGLTITYKEHSTCFDDDKRTRDIYTCVLKNKLHRYRFSFGQSQADSDYGKTQPTAYDILACIEKYPVDSFQDFCDNYGYDNDSRKAFKTYKAVMKEWKNVELLFSEDQLEILREIN